PIPTASRPTSPSRGGVHGTRFGNFDETIVHDNGFARAARRRGALSARATDFANRAAELNDASGSVSFQAAHPDQSAAAALSPLRGLVRTAIPAERHSALSADAVPVGAG